MVHWIKNAHAGEAARPHHHPAALIAAEKQGYHRAEMRFMADEEHPFFVEFGKFFQDMLRVARRCQMLSRAKRDGPGFLEHGGNSLLCPKKRTAENMLNTCIARPKESPNGNRLPLTEVTQRTIAVVNLEVSNRLPVTQNVENHDASATSKVDWFVQSLVRSNCWIFV